MKTRHMFTLLDPSFTTVRAMFNLEVLEPGEYDMTIEDVKFVQPARQSGKTHALHMQMAGRGRRAQAYTYKVPYAWNVKEGDHLIVLTAHNGLKVVTVTEVDDKPVIDVDADFDYKWAVQKVDLGEFQELSLREQKFNENMVEVERVKQRESLLDSFRTSLPEGSAARALFEQTTATLSPPVAPAAPPSAPEAPPVAPAAPVAPEAPAADGAPKAPWENQA